MKPFIAHKMTFKGHKAIGNVIFQYIVVVFLSETGKVGYPYCQTKIAEMSLTADRWHWHNSIGHVSLPISVV